MPSNSHKLLWIHSLAFVLIAATWLAALAIPAHKASTMSVALYYVLHIFTGSVAAMLSLLHWLLMNNTDTRPHSGEGFGHRITRIFHPIYYGLLVGLPVSGVLVFFDPAPSAHTAGAGLWAQLASSRPFFHLHGYLFYNLLALVVIDIIATLADRHHRKH